MFKNVAWDSPKVYILDKTMHKMHVTFCSYCTTGIPIYKL